MKIRKNVIRNGLLLLGIWRGKALLKSKGLRE